MILILDGLKKIWILIISLRMSLNKRLCYLYITVSYQKSGHLKIKTVNGWENVRFLENKMLKRLFIQSIFSQAKIESLF